MIASEYLFPALLFVVFLFSLSFLVWLPTSNSFLEFPVLYSNAITVDLLFSLPVLYFLFAKKVHLPTATVIPVTFLLILFGKRILPHEQLQGLIVAETYLLPVLELIFVGYVGVKIFRFRERLKQQGSGVTDFMDDLKTVLSQSVGSPFLQKALSTEIALLRYALFAWGGRPEGVKKGSIGFTTYKENGLIAIFCAIALAVVVEAVAVHLILASKSLALAWGLTILSIYSFFFLLSDLKATLKRRTTLDDDILVIRAGIRFTANVPYRLIRKVEVSPSDPSFGEKKDWLQNDLMGNHTVIVYLSEALVSDWFYGIKKAHQVVCLQVDDPKLFAARLNEKMNSLGISATE